MAKSPIVKLKITKPELNLNVIDIALMITTTNSSIKYAKSTSLMPLSHLHIDEAQPRISRRLPYLKAFAKWANDANQYGSLSLRTISQEYENLKQYICFCDLKEIDPFSSDGYFAYVGNSGELWRQVRLYDPKKRFYFQYDNGQEMGIKEESAMNKSNVLSHALLHCKFDILDLKNQCKPFLGNSGKSTVFPYHPSEQNIIIARLSSTFFVLASELIAYKTEGNYELPAVIKVPIITNSGIEHIEYQTDLGVNRQGAAKILGGIEINYDAAFNLCMTIAYHLICYFTSLNDSVVRELSHPISIESDTRDKSLKTVTVSGYKSRANKKVDAVFSNETDSKVVFDVDKRDGVTFISTLAELSLLYASVGNENAKLLYVLDSNSQVAKKFEVSVGTRKLIVRLHLLSSNKSNMVDWLITCFNALVKSQKSYLLGTTVDKSGRIVVTKKLENASAARVTVRAPLYAFAILSSFTDVSLKNIIIPLAYQEKNEQDNVCVSFHYENGSTGKFTIPAKYKSFLEDTEAWARTRNFASKSKYLLPIGNIYKITQWKGLSPLTYKTLLVIGIGSGNFHTELSSRRFRKTTSNEEYSDTHLPHLINLLQNEITTIQRNYIDGDPDLNNIIISQSLKVLQRMAKGDSLNDAKQAVCHEMKIEMLAHDKWIKSKEVSNPNGLYCNGEQDLAKGKKRQRETNKTLGVNLPCSEFDMCYLCKSAKGIDEPNSVYKLISFTDVLKEALDRYPDAKLEVKEKIAAFEYILLGASDNVYKDAMNRFNSNGRHPRISMDHIKVSTKGVS